MRQSTNKALVVYSANVLTHDELRKRTIEFDIFRFLQEQLVKARSKISIL